MKKQQNILRKRNEINSKLKKIDDFLNKSTVQKPQKKEKKVIEDISSIKLPNIEEVYEDPRF